MSFIGVKIISAIRLLAKARPDFVYQPESNGHFAGACYYVRDGKGSCIVGQALLELGLIDPSLEESPERNRLDAGALLPILGIELTDEQKRWISDVQYWQDRRESWSTAIELADGKGAA